MAPGFPVPPNSDYKGYHNYIDECLPPETPYLYGLHPNAEIEFLTNSSDNLFRVVMEMQPRESGSGAGGGVSREEKVQLIILVQFSGYYSQLLFLFIITLSFIVLCSYIKPVKEATYM